MNLNNAKRNVTENARSGLRVVINGKTVWAGLGNRSGLHDFQFTVIREKWEKSGERFVKTKVEALKAGDTVEIQWFSNITRDRGRWISDLRFTVDAD
jgi:hypothetical protein